MSGRPFSEKFSVRLPVRSLSGGLFSNRIFHSSLVSRWGTRSWLIRVMSDEAGFSLNYLWKFLLFSHSSVFTSE